MSLAKKKHDTNTLFGAGELYLDLIVDDAYTGERYLGDSPGAALSVTTERAQVFSADGPVAEKIVDIVRSVTRTFTLTLRDISTENLALFVAGDAATRTVAATAVADEELTVKQGRFYQLGASEAAPGGVGAIDAAASNTVVTEKADASPATYVAGTDYSVEPETGRLYIEPGGAIADDSTILVDYTPVAAARGEVKTGDAKQIRAALRYIEHAAAGKGRNFYARLCSVGASGDLGLKSRDTEQQITLTAEVQEPAGDWPALTIDGKAA